MKRTKLRFSFVPDVQLVENKTPVAGISSKKRDSRSNVCKRVAENRAEERQAAPVSDKRGFIPQQMFMAAQIAQSHIGTGMPQIRQHHQNKFAYLSAAA
jgi:hypothetical protein